MELETSVGLLATACFEHVVRQTDCASLTLCILHRNPRRSNHTWHASRSRSGGTAAPEQRNESDIGLQWQRLGTKEVVKDLRTHEKHNPELEKEFELIADEVRDMSSNQILTTLPGQFDLC